MSAFTESAFSKKLADLNSSQQSIQTLSLWLIHHRKHHESIVKTWLRELETVHEGRKLTFMYLANDVIQNSKKKGPEYGKEFAKHLPKAFSHIGTSCKSERLIGSLGRMLLIWEERGVYDSKVIEEYRSRLNKEYRDGNVEGNQNNHSGNKSDSATTTLNNNKSNTNNDSNIKPSNDKIDKRKSDHEDSTPETKRKHRDEGNKNDLKGRRKHEKSGDSSSKRSPSSKVHQHSASSPENGGGNGDLSPYVPLGDPPEPEDLIKALVNIENSASSDVVIRERIAKLPPEISEMSCLSKLEDKDAAKALSNQVNEAVDLLNDYNSRLTAEMEERGKLAAMLRDFQAEQKELLAQAEKSLEEHKKKLNNICAIQKEIRDHLSNLPDMTQLPDVTELAPLPSAGDLFNIH